MVGLLLLTVARILLLACSIVQHLDHNVPVDPLQAASDSMTESPSTRDESVVSEEEKVPSGLRYVGPPQFWVQLQGTQSCEAPVLQSSLHVEVSPSETSGAVASEKAAPEMARPQDSEELAPSPAQPALFEPSQPKPQTADSVPLALAGAEGMGGRNAVQSVFEHASLISETIAAETTSPKSTNSTIMQEMTITPPPATDAFSPPMSAQSSAGVMRTAVQLTFPLEIVSLQLTPAFKMCDLQLRSSSQLVTMRLASGNASQPSINLDITFEIAKIELENGAIRAIRLLALGSSKTSGGLFVLFRRRWAGVGSKLQGRFGAPRASSAGRCFGLPHGRLPNRGDRILGLLRSSCNYAQLDLARRLPPTAWRRNESD